MNIMLVIVTEHRRKICVRMAVGASEKDVQMQFLSEAVVMSLMGGAIGLVFGMISSVLVARLLQWPTAVPLSAVLISFLFFACVGIFFGYFPAWKAPRLYPIETLH